MRPDTARTVAVLALLAACTFLLRGVLAAICWSCLIAVSTWPLHDRMRRLMRRPDTALSAALLTASVAALLLLPVLFLAYYGLHEMPVLLRVWASSNDAGLPAPDWLTRLPLVGAWALREWNGQIAEPGALRDFAHGLVGRLNLHGGRGIVVDLGRRAMSLFFCILILYFLYRRGAELAAQVQGFATRCFGEPGVRTLDVATRAVRATVNGLVLIALAMALVMTLAYAIAGVPHAAFWGLITGLLGIVPFGAGIALAAVAVYLLAVSAPDAALALAAFGAVLIFVIDHFVRPLFISGPARVPLVLALLGIVGGLETLGILGLFVGPTLMAIAVAVWRQLVAEDDAPEGPP